MSDVEFVLYVAGPNPQVEAAVEQLRQECAGRLALSCRLTVVDVQAQPTAAAAAQVFVTPTLVQQQPAPERRVVGDLRDPQRMMAALGLAAPTPAPLTRHRQGQS